jgi:hypothetical protein
MNCALLYLLLASSSLGADAPSGDAVIRGKVGDGEIVVTTTSRLAGAIHSLKWSGKEFIDSHDHGRQLQSASNLDCGKKFIPEVFNPTEAGSMSDGAGPRSSSKLLKISAKGNELTTKTQMAFWLRPGEKSAGHRAYNDTPLSQHLLAKRVRIGYKDMPNVLDYQVTFTVPKGEKHHYAQFEALTGYMPPGFEKFFRYDPKKGELTPLDDGPGEQAHPVVFATKDGKHAMGVYSPEQPSKGYEKAGYGRFRFKNEKVVKWNCVFRVRDPDGVKAGEYRYQLYVVVGTRDGCEKSMKKLHELFRKKGEG